MKTEIKINSIQMCEDLIGVTVGYKWDNEMCEGKVESWEQYKNRIYLNIPRPGGVSLRSVPSYHIKYKVS